MFTPRTKLFSATMKADKTSLELAIIEAYAHLEDSTPSPTDGGTTFSRFSNGERNWTVPVTLVPLGGRLAAHIDCPSTGGEADAPPPGEREPARHAPGCIELRRRPD